MLKIFHVAYMDGTYGEAMADREDDALDILSRDDVEMAHGPKVGRTPRGETVSISNFSSER